MPARSGSQSVDICYWADLITVWVVTSVCPPVVGRGRTAPGRAGGQVGGERSPGGAEEAGQAGQGGQGRLGGSQGGRCLLRGGVN